MNIRQKMASPSELIHFGVLPFISGFAQLEPIFGLHLLNQMPAPNLESLSTKEWRPDEARPPISKITL
jgi:hypothetical protein